MVICWTVKPSQTLSRPGSHQVLWHLILDAGRNGGNGGNGWMGSKVDDAKWSNLLKNCFGSTQSCSFSYFILNLNLFLPEESFMLKDKLLASQFSRLLRLLQHHEWCQSGGGFGGEFLFSPRSKESASKKEMRCWVQLIHFSFRWLRWWDGPLASLVSSCWRGKLQTAAGKALCWDAQALPTLRWDSQKAATLRKLHQNR